MYGRGYVIEHVAASFRRSQEELRYKAYVTDALKALTENTMRRLIPGVGEVAYGSYIPKRWYNQEEEAQEEKTGDEIAEEIILRAGLTLKGGEQKT